MQKRHVWPVGHWNWPIEVNHKHGVRCAAVRIIACIEDPVVIEKILTHLDSKDPCTASARLPRSRAPPQSCLFG